MSIHAVACATDAIRYFLRRVLIDPRLAYYLHYTESHSRLCRAYALLTGVSESESASLFQITKTEAPPAPADENFDGEFVCESCQLRPDVSEAEERRQALCQTHARGEFMTIHSGLDQLVAALERGLAK